MIGLGVNIMMTLPTVPHLKITYLLISQTIAQPIMENRLNCYNQADTKAQGDVTSK